MIEQFLFSATITGPICLMLLLGVVLKRISLIDESFIDTASKLVFQVTLPALLFLSIVQSEHHFDQSLPFILYGLAANLLFFVFTLYTTKWYFKNHPDQGVIIQGSFRANTAIIALAYIANAYGDQGVAIAALYVAATTVLYNILAVIALSPKSSDSSQQAYRIIGKTITKNPLIIAIFAGFLCYAFAIPVPNMLLNAGQYFADMTLPLALLCTGGSLNLHSLKQEQVSTWFASGYKLILSPLFITFGGVLLGFRGIELGILFFMTAAPTAAASYVMARAMGGNPTLAANIIALTTVASLLTCTIGIVLLSNLRLM